MTTTGKLVNTKTTLSSTALTQASSPSSRIQHTFRLRHASQGRSFRDLYFRPWLGPVGERVASIIIILVLHSQVEAWEASIASASKATSGAPCPCLRSYL